MLAVLVILGGSLSVFAGNLPKQVNIYAAIEEGGSQAMRRTVLVPVSNDVFAVQPEQDYSLCTNFQLFFYFPDVTSISSFHLRISRYVVNSFVTDSSGALGSQAINLYKYTTWFSGQTAIRTSTTTDRTIDEERAVYEWTYTTGTPVGDKNAFAVIIPFNSFVWSTNMRILFKVEALSVNGEDYSVLQYQQDVHDINETIQDDSTFYQPSTEIPSPDASHIGDGGSFASSALNEKLNLFDLSGAVQRTLVPVGTYLFTPNSFGDSSAGHTAIVAISTISMALLVIVWIINSLHRSRGWIE